MTQDWSAPFTLDCLYTGLGCCVYCPDRQAALEFADVIQEAGAVVHPGWLDNNGVVQLGWFAPNPCYRFSQEGHLARRGSIECYEQDPLFKPIPKFTFYPGTSALPELDMMGSVPLIL